MLTIFSEGKSLSPLFLSSLEITGVKVYYPDFTSKQNSPLSLVLVLLSFLFFSERIIDLLLIEKWSESPLSLSIVIFPQTW